MTTPEAQDARDKANDYLAGQIGRIDSELEALRKVMRCSESLKGSSDEPATAALLRRS